MTIASICEQIEHTSLEKNETFSSCVRRKAAERDMSQAALAEASNLSKATITRIFRDNNYEGTTYLPTLETVLALALALEAGTDGLAELLEAAFPGLPICLEMLEEKRSVMEANGKLEEIGAPLLGHAPL